MKSLRLTLNFKKLKEKGYQIEKEILKDKKGNYICEEFETTKVIGHNVRGLNRNFIFKIEKIKEEAKWFELPYEDIIDQVLIRQVQEIIYERIEYLNNLQEYYQTIEEDDDEEYGEIVNERNVLEEIVSHLHNLVKIEFKEKEVHFIACDCETYYILEEFLSYDISDLCKKEYCLIAFIDKKGE